jgi:hypothetical protein
MKSLLLGILLSCGLFLMAPASDAVADSDSWSDSGGDSGDRAGVPELDATVAGSAMVLLLGGVAYIASRRRDDS